MHWVDVFWTQENIEHLAEHGVSTEDADAILRSPDTIQVSRSSGRWIAFGDAADGRRLGIVFDRVDSMTYYPVTAFEV